MLCTDVCYMNVRTPKDWTPLSYCKAKGKYGATEEKGIYPEVDALSLYRTLPAPIQLTNTITLTSQAVLFTPHMHVGASCVPSLTHHGLRAPKNASAMMSALRPA